MFVTITLAPALDCTLTVDKTLTVNGIHRVQAETYTPGGKGVNVAKILALDGCPVIAGGLLGHAEQPAYDQYLATHGIQPEFLTVPHPTRRNLMITDGQGHEIKLNRAAFPDLEFHWPTLEAYATRLAAHGEVMILSGSLPARFPAGTYGRLIRLFKRLGKTVVLDAGGEALRKGVAAGPDIIKPNRKELTELTGRPMQKESAVLAELQALAQRHKAVIVSGGGADAWFAANGQFFRAQPPRVKVVDTTGAGDFLLGQFCADWFGGSAPRTLSAKGIRRAMAAGTAAVELAGTPVPQTKRIESLSRRVRVGELS